MNLVGLLAAIRGLTACASAAGVLRHEPMQATRDNLTATPLAGLDYRQVYTSKRRDASARLLRTRRGRRSAACAGWAAHGGLGALLSKRGLRIPTWWLLNARLRRAVCVTQRVSLPSTAGIDSQASRAVLSPHNRIAENPRRPTAELSRHRLRRETPAKSSTPTATSP